MSTTDDEMEAYSRGFDAGNYHNAYVSTDFDDVDFEEEVDGGDTLIFRDAFIIGFFASYETEEVSEDHRDELLEATARRFELAKEAGMSCPYRNVPGQVDEDSDVCVHCTGTGTNWREKGNGTSECCPKCDDGIVVDK